MKWTDSHILRAVWIACFCNCGWTTASTYSNCWCIRGVIHKSLDDIRVQHQSSGGDSEPNPSTRCNTHRKGNWVTRCRPVQFVPWTAIEQEVVVIPRWEDGILSKWGAENDTQQCQHTQHVGHLVSSRPWEAGSMQTHPLLVSYSDS